MRLITKSAAAVALAIGAWSVVDAPPAHAALEPSVLEAVEKPEVALVAQEIAALLDSFGADAEEQAITSALHRYLADSPYEDGVLEDALAVVLAGQWSPTQFAALRGIFAEYAPQDLKAPGGPDTDTVTAPAGAMLSRASVDETSAETTSDQAAGRAQIQGLLEPPPPPAGGGGSSDYRR